MSTIQERTNEAVAKQANPFATGARSKKVAQIIDAIGKSENADEIFGAMVDHELTESQWRLVDGIAALKHPSSEVTRECVRQVVIFGAHRKRPNRLSALLTTKVREFLS